MKRQYEVLIIFPGTLSPDEIKPLYDGVQELVKKHGGTGVVLTDLGKSRLAYPIKHIRYGYFFVGYFDAEADVLPTITEKLRLFNGLLRVTCNIYDARKPKKTGQILSDVAILGAMEDAREKSEMQPRERAVVETVQMNPTHGKTVERPVVEKTEAIHLEDIEKKLDEILDSDLTKV